MSAIVGQRRWEIFVAAGFALLAGYAVAGGNAPVAIALVAGTVAIAIAVDRPTAAAMAMAIAAAAFAGLKRGFPVPGLRISELLIVGAGALVLTHAPATRRGARTPFVAWATLYVAATATLGTVDLLRLGQPFSADAVGKLIGPLEFLILFVTVRACSGERASRERAARWILLAAVPVSAIAVLQALGVSSLRHFAQVYALDTDSTRSFHTIYRATGLFNQGHILSAYLMVVVILGVAVLLDGSANVLSRRTVIMVLAATAAGMAAAATAIPLLGTLAGTMIVAWRYGRVGRSLLSLVVALSVTGIVIGPVIAARYEQEATTTRAYVQPGLNLTTNGALPASVAYRVAVWTQEFLPTIGRNIVTGYGPELPPGAVWQYTESQYVTLLLRGGLPLLVIYGFLSWSLFTEARREGGRQGVDRVIGRTVEVLTVILVPMLVFNNYFINPGLAELWWILAGLLFAATDSLGTASARFVHQKRAWTSRTS
jgi:hypothetical protein